MSSSSATLLSLQEILEARKTFPPLEALKILGRLLDQVRALHVAGQVHRAIGLRSVALDARGEPLLLPAESVCRLGGTAGSDEPPEMQEAGEVVLPSSRREAAQALADVGLPLDPVRIDVYQLSVLLCRLLTGQPVTAYLHSPRVKAAVPAGLQPVIDRALGFDPTDRCASCDELAALLGAAWPGHPGDPAVTCPPAPLEALSARPPGPPETSPQVSGPCVRPGGQVPLPFEKLGPYRILERLGQGGMGDVYLGSEEALQRRVAIKVLPPALAGNDDFVRRFRAEATAVAQLEHPNIVPIYGTGQEAGVAYFVMQYIEGESLEQLLARRERLSLEETLSILEQCLLGLEAAHEAGLVHRDVKPGNILLHSKTQRALVADFGLVKSNEPGAGATATGVIMGTVDYIAPEQARGLAVDGRADLYAVGVIAYRMLSGRLPFQAATPTAMIFQHAYETPPPLPEVAPDIPKPVAVLVGRLMAKDPAVRYPSCAAVLADIRRYRAGEPLEVLPPTAGPGAAQPFQGMETGSPDWADPLSWWQRLHRRVSGWLLAHAPKLVPNLRGTLQQVDGALALSQQRRDALALLIAEAQAAADELAAQALSCRAEAAAQSAESAKRSWERNAAALDQQAAEQEDQLAQLRPRLAELDANLRKMTHQRDLLHARLRVAEAGLAGKPSSSRRRRRAAAVLGLVAGVAALLGLGLYLLPTTRTPGPGRGFPDARETKVVQEAGRFHLLSRDGRSRRMHATLASAVEAAAAGDTIEIQDNEPLVSGFVQVRVPLRIRAAAGARPIISFQPPPVQEWWHGLLEVSAPLVLEGIELRYHRPTLGGVIEVIEVASDLRMTGCRIVAQGEANAVFLRRGSAELDRCEIFTGPWGGIRWNFDESARLVLNDCVLAGGESLVLHSYTPRDILPDLDLHMSRCTLVGERAILNWLLEHTPPLPGTDRRPLRVHASQCVFSLVSPEQGLWTLTGTDAGALQEAEPARKLLTRAVSWSDDRNLYPEQTLLTLSNLSREGKLSPAGRLCVSLEDWSRLWGLSRTSSLQGAARLQGGDILARLQASFPAVLPSDFRLIKGSPGQGAGPEGGDLGARTDLVGPGGPYQDWQKTPDYQRWCKQTEVLLKRP